MGCSGAKSIQVEDNGIRNNNRETGKNKKKLNIIENKEILNENKFSENEKGKEKPENIEEKKDPGEIKTSEINKKILEKLDKNKLQTIANKAPERIKSNIGDFIKYLKKSIKPLDDFEKAYIIFYWLHKNIEYDIKNIGNKDLDTTPISVYKAGKTICEGYSKFYEYIGKEIGINIIYVTGMVKRNQLSETFGSHAWNILKVKENYYLIDSPWGAGSVEEKSNKYIKKLKEFYFCSDPEYFIFSHFPSESKWQLLKNPIGNEEFSKTIKFSELFFKFFKGSNQIYYIIKTNKECTIRLYKKLEKTKKIMYLFWLKKRSYIVQIIMKVLLTI